MKIAICNVQEFNPTIGGVERVSVSLATILIECGIEVIFIACQKSIYSQKYELPAKQLFLPKDLDYCIENVKVFIQIIKDEKIDILLNQNSHSELYNRTCFEVKQNSDVKLISALHFSPNMRIKANRNLINFKHFSLKENFINILRDICTRFPFKYITMYDQRRMMKNLYNNSDKVVLLSEKYIKMYTQISGLKDSSKILAINNPLSFPYEYKIYPKKKQVIYCGRLFFSQKRPDRMLYVWKKVQEKLTDWNLVIVGDGSFIEKMKQISIQLKLKRIEFLGFTDPINYYKDSSIFCLTSNHEGWGLVLTEAMQYGCVPVAFDSYESIHDIIQDGKNGFLIKPFNLNKFADKILYLANSDITTYSKESIKSVERLSFKNIINCWINLFKETMQC